MAKTWEQMSQSEKIEDLRRDIKSLMQAFSTLGADHNRQSNLLSEVAAAVKKLEEGKA